MGSPLPLGGPSFRTFVRMVALSSRVHRPAPGCRPLPLWDPLTAPVGGCWLFRVVCTALHPAMPFWHPSPSHGGHPFWLVVIVTSGWPLLPPLGADGDSFESSTPSFTWRWGMCASWRVWCVCFWHTAFDPQRGWVVMVAAGGCNGVLWTLFQVRHLWCSPAVVVVIWGVTTHTRLCAAGDSFESCAPVCGEICRMSHCRGIVYVCVSMLTLLFDHIAGGLSLVRLFISPAADVVLLHLGDLSYRPCWRLLTLSSRVHCPVAGYEGCVGLGFGWREEEREMAVVCW